MFASARVVQKENVLVTQKQSEILKKVFFFHVAQQNESKLFFVLNKSQNDKR